jgi:nucleotide-binding universal stress UspA family protein
MPRTILAATDFSPGSTSALFQAAHLAQRSEAALHVLHVPATNLASEIETFFPDAGDYGLQEAVDALRERIASQLAASDAPKDTKIHVHPGSPFREIVRAIDEIKPDLLVIGSTGETGQKLGTVGGKCVRKTAVDTLLVPAGFNGAFSHITACIDFSDLSPVVMDAGTTFARLDGGSLTALYAHEKVDESVFLKGPPQELLDKLPAVIEDRFNDQLAPIAEGVGASFAMITCRTYSEGIVRHATESKTDLVICGTTGRSGLAYLLLGTTAEKVIRDVGCAVLAVKPRKAKD